MTIVTLAVLDTDFEEAVTGVASIIRRMTRITAGGILCLVDHSEDEIARQIIRWFAHKQLRVTIEATAGAKP